MFTFVLLCMYSLMEELKEWRNYLKFKGADENCLYSERGPANNVRIFSHNDPGLCPVHEK